MDSNTKKQLKDAVTAFKTELDKIGGQSSGQTATRGQSGQGQTQGHSQSQGQSGQGQGQDIKNTLTRLHQKISGAIEGSSRGASYKK